MPNFKFNFDYQVVVWKRNEFCIEAETQEEALKIAKDLAADGDLYEWNDFTYDLEYLSDWEDQVEPTTKATEELYYCPSKDEAFEAKVIWSNTPIQVVRDGKIDELLS